MTRAAKAIKKMRLKMNLSPPALSVELGLKSKGHIWMIENGLKNPSVALCHRIIRLASGYGIDLTLDELLGE